MGQQDYGPWTRQKNIEHPTLNAEHRTPNMRAWQGAKGKEHRSEVRDQRVEGKEQRAKGEERRAKKRMGQQDYGPRDVGAKRLVIGSQLSVNW
jgi:hypothetical protein